MVTPDTRALFRPLLAPEPCTLPYRCKRYPLSTDDLRYLGMAEGLDSILLPAMAGLNPLEVPAPLASYHVAPYNQVDAAIGTLAEKLTPAASA
jgi:hypothetical protein